MNANPMLSFEQAHVDAHDLPPAHELFPRHDWLDFNTRSRTFNPMVDIASPLFGLVIRLRKTEQYGPVEQLYQHVNSQISTLLEELHQYDQYEHADRVVYSYCLCVFVDEAVMATPWGGNSSWKAQPLLSSFHQETWGGEKFFTLLSRLVETPDRYADLIVFMYLCLCLGFKGQYSVQTEGDQQVERWIARLQKLIAEQRGPAPERLTTPLDNVAPRHYQMNRQWPVWTPWLVAAVICASAYVFFSMRLDTMTEHVLRSLEQILVT